MRPDEAARRAGYRVFGSKPGAYGAGLQTLIDERIWDDEADLAEAYLGWGGYAYGAGAEGRAERAMLETRLACAEAVLHNQDNREHDLLDSDDYYQFEGGLALAVRRLSGRIPAVWHNDHSRPERPRIRSLREEIGRVVRGRAANPRWIRGVMRHGYKGASEIAATVDYLFAFAATSRAVDDAHFEALYDAYLADERRARLYGEAQSRGAGRDQPPFYGSDRPWAMAPTPQQRPQIPDAMEHAPTQIRTVRKTLIAGSPERPGRIRCADATAARRPAEHARRVRRRGGKRHRLGSEQRHIDRTTGLAGSPFRRPDQRLELAVVQLDIVEFLVEIADIGAQILLILVGIEQRGQPVQTDDPVDSRRAVDPPERIGRRQIDAFVGDREKASPVGLRSSEL